MTTSTTSSSCCKGTEVIESPAGLNVQNAARATGLDVKDAVRATYARAATQ